MLLTSDGTAQVAAARCTLRTDPTNPRLDPNINLSAAFGEFGRMADMRGYIKPEIYKHLLKKNM